MSQQVYAIHVLVKEVSQWLYSGDPAQCKIKTAVKDREWLYCFELKGALRLGLHVEKRNGSLQISVRELDGSCHGDVFAFGKLIFRNVGGPEKRLLGASIFVEIPAEKPKPPVPPAPPEIPEVIPPPTAGQEPLTVRLDVMIQELANYEDKLDKIIENLGLFPVKANTYSVVTVDLGVERASFEQFLVRGFALTVFSNDGTFDLKIGELATDAITIAPLTYPAMLTFDRIDFDKIFISNTKQTGRSAVLIVWRRE